MPLFFLVSLFFFTTFGADPTPIATSLDGNVDWSRSQPWINLLRQARSFGSAQSPYDGNCTVDSNGWPTQDFGIVIQTGGISLGGTYYIQCTGKADITPAATSGSISNSSYDSSTNTQKAYLVVNDDADQIMLSFRNTNNGAQNIVVLLPGYDMSRSNDFTDAYIQLVSRFVTLRFMDWADTNDSPVVNWSDRTPPTSPSFAASGKGVPWEQAIKLCNQVQRDMWINIPHMATDDYVNQLATLIYQNLNSNLNVYFEYSNEVWNWQFTQATYDLNQAEDEVNNQGDPYKLNYDNCGNSGYWQWRRTAQRAVQIGNQFAQVFGSKERPTGRVRPVLAGQVSQPFVVQNGLQYIEAVWGPPSQFLYAIAGAPYFNLGNATNTDGLTSQQVLDYLNDSVNAMAVSTGIGSNNVLAVHVGWAGWYRLKMLGYEGGPDTFGPTSIEAKKDATLDPQMESIVVNYLNTWNNYGFGPLNWFVAGASDYDTDYGTWGVLEDMHNFDVPKLRGIDDVRLAAPAPTTIGPLSPVQGYNATQWVGHPVPDVDPYLRYLNANNTYMYIIRLANNSNLKVTVYAQTYTDSPQLEIGLNSENLQIITMNNSPSSFSAQPGATFTNVLSGVNIIRLRIVTNRGYDISLIDFSS